LWPVGGIAFAAAGTFEVREHAAAEFNKGR
jgi:hypothetical protein